MDGFPQVLGNDRVVFAVDDDRVRIDSLALLFAPVPRTLYLIFPTYTGLLMIVLTATQLNALPGFVRQ
nr:hypothetical protein [Paenibacillus harenae]